MLSNITVITLPSPVFDTGGRVACGKSLLMLPVARIVLGDGSMKRSAVRPSVRLSVCPVDRQLPLAAAWARAAAVGAAYRLLIDRDW